jgi:hypothetical protein
MTKIKLTGNSVAPEENPPCTIDMTPTWAAAARIYIMALENGTGKGKQMARDEIERMGILLDSLLDARKDAGAGVAGE